MIDFKPLSEYKDIEIELPSSKSISNRVLIMDFVRDGRVLKREGMSESDDTKILSEILSRIELGEEGCFNVGNNGAICRFLIPLLATIDGSFVVDGDDRMRNRPINEIVEAVNTLGVKVTYEVESACLPVKIEGNSCIISDYVEIDCSRSSQFVSAIMMIAPRLKNGIRIKLKGGLASKPYVEMTAGLMSMFGVTVVFEEDYITIEKGQKYSNPNGLVIEKDWSSASYWYLATSLLPQDSSLILKGLSDKSMQGDSVIAQISNNWGVDSEMVSEGMKITKKSGNIDFLELNCQGFPDLVPTIAVACSSLNIKARLKGVEILRFKESDRLNSLICELRNINSNLKFTDNTLEINPDFRINNSHFNSYYDHRLVMSFSVLAIKMGRVLIENTSVIDKSYPCFFEEISKIGVFKGDI